MSTINKVPASAGAEWLLAGFTLLRRAPLGLMTLPLLWMMVTTVLVVLAAATGQDLALMVMQWLLVLVSPLFFGAMIWAVREVDQGRPTSPQHLWEPVRQGHARALLATWLPQVVAAIVLGILLLVMIGPDELNHLDRVWNDMRVVAEAGGRPNPKMVEGLPAGRLLLWLMLVPVCIVVTKWMTFIASPQILFTGTDAITAMRNSLRACVRNWTAMVVFYLLAAFTILVLTFCTMVLALMAQLLAGPIVAVMLLQLVLIAVLTPVLSGAMYAAWRQMMSPVQIQGDAVAQVLTQIEV